jgi:hypothetical protein
MLTRKEIDRIAARLPVHKQIALELVEVRDELRKLVHMLACALADVAVAAARIFYELGHYHKHRQVPRHR